MSHQTEPLDPILSNANLKLQSLSRKATLMTKLSVGFLTVVIAFSLSASSYALYDQLQESSHRRTEQQWLNDRFKAADIRQLEAIRTVLCLANKQVQTSDQRTPAEKATAKLFYAEALSKIHAKPCPPIKK